MRPSDIRSANLAPECAELLAQVGIDFPSQLEQVGAVGAYVAIHRRGLKPTLTLLYALEAALRNVPWTQLPHHVRAALTLEVDALLAADKAA